MCVAYLFWKLLFNMRYQRPSRRVLFMLEGRRGGGMAAKWCTLAGTVFTHEHSTQWHMLSLGLINHWRSDVRRRESVVSFDTWLAFLSLRLTLNITPAVWLYSHRLWAWRGAPHTDSLTFQQVQKCVISHYKYLKQRRYVGKGHLHTVYNN